MKTIMVVDDEATSLAYMESILSRSGYRVIAESNAASALARIRNGCAVDLVITDYRMPDMDGLELLNELRIVSRVPLIMVTGYGDIESYLKAINLGAFEYLNKPIGARELDRIVRTALQLEQAS
jgi:two-component system response regulator (stage 0 sporulation protein F)